LVYYLELWSWRIAPGDVRRSEAHRPGTREIVRVAGGRITVAVGGTREELRAGQLALLAGDRLHRYENPGRTTAVFTLVVHEPVH
jgi:quercetin dioxygenase-like cupin family protein